MKPKSYLNQKYYGHKVSNCGNSIRGLDKILAKLKEENADEDRSESD